MQSTRTIHTIRTRQFEILGKPAEPKPIMIESELRPGRQPVLQQTEPTDVYDEYGTVDICYFSGSSVWE